MTSTELALARQMHLVPVGQEPDYAAVNAAYRHLMGKFPGHLAAKEAFLYLQSIQLALLEPQSTRAAADQLLEWALHCPPPLGVGRLFRRHRQIG